MDRSYVLAGLLLQLIGVEKCKELRSRSCHISKTTITKSKTKKKTFSIENSGSGQSQKYLGFLLLVLLSLLLRLFQLIEWNRTATFNFCDQSFFNQQRIGTFSWKKPKKQKTKKKNIQQICCFEFAVVKIQLKPFKYWPDLRGWISLLQFLVNIKYWSYL